MSNVKKYFPLVLALICFNISLAIVIRHDVSDEAYQKLGEQFPSFVSLSNGCGGTLVAPNWVLTAAHCTGSGMTGETLFDPGAVMLDEEEYVIGELIRHGQADLALLRLCRDVTTIEPAPLYKKTDEEGQVAVLVGRGGTGNGLEGLTADDRILRGARNVIEWTDDSVLAFEMNEPDTALDLEGVGGPGDSGGPAYLETTEGWLVAGVSAYGEWFYGDFDHYVRVSSHIDWLETTMQESDVSQEDQSLEYCLQANQTVELSPELLETYSGVYAYVIRDKDYKITLSHKGGTLFYQILGTPKLALIPSSETEFVRLENDTHLMFEATEENVTELVLKIGGNEFGTSKVD